MLRLTVCAIGAAFAFSSLCIEDASARHRFHRRFHGFAKVEKVEKLRTEPSADVAEIAEKGKPVLLGTFGEWGAYRTQTGRSKVCYAFAKPKERQPASAQREASYVLLSTRPGDHVRDEVSVIMGVAMKDGSIGDGADINGNRFDLVAKGQNAWIKSPAEEAKMVDTLRRGSRLTIKASTVRGREVSDTYLLAGVSEALDAVAKECR